MRPVITLSGSAGATVKVAGVDTAAALSDAIVKKGTAPAQIIACAVQITVETKDIRIAFGGTTPTQGAGATGHLVYAGQSIEISGGKSVRSFKWVNATNGQAATLQVTPFFEPGG